MSGQTPSSGYVLTASDSSGDATWSSAGSVGGWTIVGNNIYNVNTGNVGINTINGANVGIGTSTPQGAFVVTNGNVGIGTWAPKYSLDMIGNLGIGTLFSGSNFVVTSTGNVGIGTWIPNSSLSIIGSIGVVTVSESGSYTATANDHVILVNANFTPVTITLPLAVGSKGRMYQIKKTDATTNAMIIQVGGGGDKIDGASSISSTTQYQNYTLVCDGERWWLI